MKHLLNNKNYTFLGLTLTMTALIKQINDSRIQNLQNISIQTNLAQLSEDTKNLIRQTSSHMEEIKKNQNWIEKYNEILIKNGSDLNTAIDDTSKAAKSMTDIMERLNDPNLTVEEKNRIIDLMSNELKTYYDSVTNLNSNMENLQNALSIFKKDNSNKFIDPLSEYIKNFQDFLATLDLIHTLNMVHILASMCLFFTLLSMVTIYYGDYLIQYFRLETKYPKLAKWIKIRRQLQHYSLMWNMFLAFILILTIFTLNIWMFIVL